MNFRPFAKTGWQIPEVGLGTWQLGGDWKKLDDKSAAAILRTAVDQGVRFFDTADVYGRGLSEERIGRFLRDCSERIIVATKLGRFPEPGWPRNFSLENLRQHTENSLKRLGVEALDLTQLHCIPTDFLKRKETFDWLRILQKEGKIRHFGVSVESMDEALFCLEQDGVTSLQIIFSIFRQKPIEVLFEKAKQKQVALIIRLPMASGLLSGKFSRQTLFAADDHRQYNADGQAFNVGETFAGIPFAKGLELVEQLKGFVPPGLTLSQLALRWILDHDAVSIVIPGATSIQQVVANVNASRIPPLSSALHRNLQDFYQAVIQPNIRGKY